MRRYIWVILISTSFVLPAVIAASAMQQSAPSSMQKRVALIIGMGKYASAGQLKNPVNDANDIAQMLRSLGFDVLLATDLSINDFDRTVEQFIYKLSTADAALFYYAGHGIQYRGENFLVPIDAQLESETSIRRETLSVNFIIEKMEEASPLNLVFLDACRNNPLAEKLVRTIKSQGRSINMSRGLAPIETQKGDSLIVFATAPGDVAADGTGRNSPFTSALLSHMDTPGLDVEVMLKRVKRDVRNASNGQQSPETLSRLAKEFVFNSQQAPAPQTIIPSQQTIAATRDSSRDKTAEAATVWKDVKQTTSQTMLNTFIDRYPDTIYADFAKVRLQELTRSAERSSAAPEFDPNAKPSFSCAKYTSLPQQHEERDPHTDILCIDAELADADRRMGNLYGILLKRLNRSDRQKLKQMQTEWIKRRNTNCPATWQDLKKAARVEQISTCLLTETKSQDTRLTDWIRRTN